MILKLTTVKHTGIRLSKASLHTIGPYWISTSNELTRKILLRVGGWGDSDELNGNKVNLRPAKHWAGLSLAKMIFFSWAIIKW